MSTQIVVAGFGKAEVNGTYLADVTRNGHDSYKMASNGFLITYITDRMPYAADDGYVILAIDGIQGAVKSESYPYLKISDVANAATSGWITTLPAWGKETAVGTLTAS